MKQTRQRPGPEQSIEEERGGGICANPPSTIQPGKEKRGCDGTMEERKAPVLSKVAVALAIWGLGHIHVHIHSISDQATV